MNLYCLQIVSCCLCRDDRIHPASDAHSDRKPGGYPDGKQCRLCRLWAELVAGNYVLSWTIDICLQLQDHIRAHWSKQKNLTFLQVWMIDRIVWNSCYSDGFMSFWDIHLHASDIILSKPSSMICLCLMQVKVGVLMFFISFICIAIIGFILDLRYVILCK